MGSASGPTIVDQLQQEMDDLNRLQYSTEYSTDINSKMQMPSRLSLEPESESFLDVEPSQKPPDNDIIASPAHGMNVPDRILLAGSGSHFGMKEDPRDLNLDFPEPDFSKAGQQHVELTTPPRTLTLDEFHFPTVGTEGKEKNGAVKKLSGVGDESAILDTSGVSLEEPSIYNLQKQVKLLAQRIGQLEERESTREFRETILMALASVYFLYKGFRFLTANPY